MVEPGFGRAGMCGLRAGVVGAGRIQQVSGDETKEEIERRSWSDFLRWLARLRR